MHIDKQTAANWQINASIRNIWNGECVVATHVVALSARQILIEYAKAKSIELSKDVMKGFTDEFRSDAESMWKERYNYFKHSDRDAEHTVDITNIAHTNEWDTLFNVINFTTIFRGSSMHMRWFTIYMGMRFPKLWDLEKLSREQRQALQRQPEEIGEMSRQELCKFFADRLNESPLSEELLEVKQQNFLEPKTVPVRSSKPFFKRKIEA